LRVRADRHRAGDRAARERLAELQNELTADIERQNIRVAKSPTDKAEYTLRGYVVSSLEKKGSKAKISYIWDVTDGSGKGVHRVSGEETVAAGKSKDPWTAVTPAVIQSIATKTVSSVTAWLPSGAPVASNGTAGLVQTAAATQFRLASLYPHSAAALDRYRQHRQDGSGQSSRSERRWCAGRRQLRIEERLAA
jgi:hypothetical protein